MERDVIVSSFQPWLGEGFLLPREAMERLSYDAIVLAVLTHLLCAAQERFQFCNVRGNLTVSDRKQILILRSGMLAIYGVVVERDFFHSKLHLRGFDLYTRLRKTYYQSFVHFEQLL